MTQINIFQDFIIHVSPTKVQTAWPLPLYSVLGKNASCSFGEIVWSGGLLPRMIRENAWTDATPSRLEELP